MTGLFVGPDTNTTTNTNTKTNTKTHTGLQRSLPLTGLLVFHPGENVVKAKTSVKAVFVCSYIFALFHISVF